MVSCKSNPVNKRLFKMLKKKHPVNHPLPYCFDGGGGGPILPSPVSTFFLAGKAGTLNPPFSP